MISKQLFPALFIGAIISLFFLSCDKAEDIEDPVEDNPIVLQTGSFTDARDNKVYDWVKIGEQVWMVQNLAYKLNQDGCWAYNNEESNSNTYGYLYDWYSIQDIAPAGWHVPTDDEWSQLITYLRDNGYHIDDGYNGVAKALASDSGWEVSDGAADVGSSDYPELRNKTGFTAIPGGYRNYDGDFVDMGVRAMWWSSTFHPYDSANSFGRCLQYNGPGNLRLNYPKENAFSIRCVRD